ncbi:5-oxoprolinase/urea amidolyase family protein [Demequina sp. NBRC 110055]|uniref:5-oxoprolinase/urea amidolyase family protein n=1 Tax=Demequina sp. NBRC 110055 TaxID=1570344 RepID=UPI00190EC862|nr:5-oxoprolinase/urea amidolyase family protein [Demequina sp. NBRC 110055]
MVVGKVLVANRAEIAVRIARSVTQLGGTTLAIYADDDAGSGHVRVADQAVALERRGDVDPYMDIDQIVAVALAHDVWAIHPGYGFLSENPDFARAVEAAGLVFLGPAPAHIDAFGDKQAARAHAVAAGVPLAAATPDLRDAAHAGDEIARIGLPVILKAAGGGGGKGMAVLRDLAEVEDAYATVRRVADVAGGGVFAESFIEHARHVEVQVFGDGEGRVVTLGDRDCTLQRRNQKVVEEAPAFDLDPAVRSELHATARALAASVNYRSAGTVEFVVDARTGRASFLEINTRLQVEHPVTEAITGVDLVAWMIRLGAGDTSFLDLYDATGEVPVEGYAVESRVYAEDPGADFRPSPGTITRAAFAADARVDTWVSAGTEVSPRYDPMIAKVINYGRTREEAWERHGSALVATRIDGIQTNLALLRAIATDRTVARREHTTATLGSGAIAAVDDLRVEAPGFLTTVQEERGRTGLWHIGVPPSGPMDDRSFALGNRALGNGARAAGLECTVSGPRLRFGRERWVCVTGAPAEVAVDGAPVAMWEPFLVPAGAVVEVGRVKQGLRAYVLVEGGIDVPEHLGSRATFTLGRFGGHAGRALVAGDVLPLGVSAAHPADAVAEVPYEARPSIGHTWEIGVLDGPHSAPDFFTEADVDAVLSEPYEVHFNSDRTGVRLVGPRPRWARQDGGEAGLHPSNIHDTPYSVGGMDFTGDTPVLLGPDGPSLGGFVTPVTIAKGERWKLGQLAPGDTVRMVRLEPAHQEPAGAPRGVLAEREGLVLRRQGDDSVLIELGALELDLMLRARIHVLHQALRDAPVEGMRDLTPGIRSLQVTFEDPSFLTRDALDALVELAAGVAEADDLVVPSRHVRLPMSWDDPATREAIARYEAGVRDDAPWNPWNIEFIRRVNGLEGVDDVYRTLFEAEYLVLGLGDVYLGAPVATPLDPRHRLVTTKYNPARTWTAENSVGIGGAYLCIYGMEGPGGYQFVGRTTQVWDRWASFAGDDRAVDGTRPWLLDFFDRITWYPVEADELLRLRADFSAGLWRPEITEGTMSMREHAAFLDDNAQEIAAFRATQRAAFAAERDAWEAAGEFDRVIEPAVAAAPAALAEGCVAVEAPFAANVWKVLVAEGEWVDQGDTVAVVEAMKMETKVVAPHAGTVDAVLAGAGATVGAGDAIVSLRTVA